MDASSPNLSDYYFKLTTKAKISNGSYILSKLSFFDGPLLIPHLQIDNLNGGNLYLLISDDNPEAKLYSAFLVTRNNNETSNCESKYNLIWSAHISSDDHFLKSLRSNYERGKIEFLLEFNGSELEIFIVITSSCFLVEHPEDFKGVKGLKIVFDTLFPQKSFVLSDKGGSIQELYDYVKRYHRESADMSENLHCKYQHENLLPSLRKYQAQAVHWMIEKETGQADVTSKSPLHPLWQEINCVDGQKIYYNTYSGGLSKKRFSADIWPKGGILADEMGLGKTVEVLALIFNHQSPKRHCNGSIFQYGPVSRTDKIFTVKHESEDEVKQTSIKDACEHKLDYHTNEKISAEGLIVDESKQSLNDELFEHGLAKSTDSGLGSLSKENEKNNIYDPPLAKKSCKDQPMKTSTDCEQNPSQDLLHKQAIDNVKTETVFSQNDSISNFTNCQCAELHNHADRNITDDIQLKNKSVRCLCQRKYIETSMPENSSDKQCESDVLFSSDTSSTPSCSSPSISENQMEHEKVIFRYCNICADNNESLDDISKVKCYHCTNVMHKQCAGYSDLNLKEYECPSCATKKGKMVETHCTLIVCPDALLDQWEDEVLKHVKKETFTYLVYKGVRHQFMQPNFLAQFDLIITSFSTLRLDFHFTLADGTTRKLRGEKKYILLPCPLLSLNFWRMCIDEAQLVESDATKVSKMALKINAVHRWCITGTPLQRSVEDIYGLILFLSVRPYCSKSWWSKVLLEPHRGGNHKPLFDVVSKIMWRSSKVDVEEQINIPKQTEHVTWLHFSAVEQHFYQKQLEYCARRLNNCLQYRLSDVDLNVALSNMNHQTLISLISPLLQLRQACCHPAAVTQSFLPLEKKCVTMDQLLDRLISNQKVECEEELRKLLCAINGLAGIEVLLFDHEKAAQLYFEAISTWEKFGKLKADSLQKLHTLHNLHSIMCYVNGDDFPSIKSEYLEKECDGIRLNYLKIVNEDVFSCKESMNSIMFDINSTYAQIDARNPWWLNIFRKLDVQKERILEKVKEELASAHHSSSKSCICGKFHTSLELQYVLYQQLQSIEEEHAMIQKRLKALSKHPEKDQIQQCAECCLRPVPNSNASKCNYCVLKDYIMDYEKSLFSSNSENNLTGETAGISGFRGQTELDKVLHILYTSVKKSNLKEMIQQAREHMKYRELLKKEFECIRSLFSAYYARVQALDELDMCVTRMRYEYDGEEDLLAKPEVVPRRQLYSKKMNFEVEKNEVLNTLKSKECQLLYLQNLATVQTEHDGFNQELCPICVSPFGTEWVVFKCGHCFCVKCVAQLKKSFQTIGKRSVSAIKCPYCRSFSQTDEISFVVTKQRKCEQFDSDISIEGNFSSKIEGVLRRINWILQKHPGSKVLVFSMWTSVLHQIRLALELNKIPVMLIEGKSLKNNLRNFKSSPDIDILLMPLFSGSKGLNIIEATHVILVEPALNPADELQAIGRVHRIGQTKETFVHRFIITGTVEEKIHSLWKDRYNSQQYEFGITISDVTSLLS